MDLNWIEQEISSTTIYISMLDKIAKRELRPNSVTPDLRMMLSDPEAAGAKIRDWAGSPAPAFQPLHKIELKTGDKTRTIYTANWPDRVVLMVLQDLIARRLEPLYSERLHSYRKKRSTLGAHRAFQGYLKNHPSVWVAKRDITGYGESILPSVLQEKIARHFPSSKLPRFRTLLDQTLTPDYHGPDGTPVRLETGIASGSPLTPVLENLYLMELDQMLDLLCAEDPSCFYARYGDDFVFACPDEAKFNQTVRTIDETVASVGLTYSENKKINCELGRTTRYLEWLGASFSATGLIGPKPKHFRSAYAVFIRAFESLLRELALKFGDFPESKVAIQTALNQFLRESTNPNLGKLLLNRNHPSTIKTLDHNIRMLLVRWLTRHFKMKKSEAWKALHSLQIPSLNFQRRYRWSL